MDSDLDFPLSFPPSFAFFLKEGKRGVFNVAATTSFSDVLSPLTPLPKKGTVSTRLRMGEGSNLSSHSVQRRPDSTVDNAIACHQSRIITSWVQISSRREEGAGEWRPLCECDTWLKPILWNEVSNQLPQIMKQSSLPAPLPVYVVPPLSPSLFSAFCLSNLHFLLILFFLPDRTV